MELSDAGQTVTDTWRYQAFGEALARTGTSANPFGFVGELGYYQEADLRLHYVRARWYEARTGRWVSEDPVEGGSLYGYVGNRPTRGVDPSGRAEAASWGDVLLWGADPMNPCTVGQTRIKPGHVIKKGSCTKEELPEVGITSGTPWWFSLNPEYKCWRVRYPQAVWEEELCRCIATGERHVVCQEEGEPWYRMVPSTAWRLVGTRRRSGQLTMIHCVGPFGLIDAWWETERQPWKPAGGWEVPV